MQPRTYLQHWRALGRPARLYLLHAALLTGSLAISGLVFNLAILALGYDLAFLGTLNGLSIRIAVLLSLPLWWLVVRMGLRPAMLLNAVLQAAAAFLYAFDPSQALLLVAVGLTGMAAVVFQVSSPPFMMRYSDAATRDYLFSANAGINIGVAGLGTLLAGGLPALFGQWLGVGAESALAYRATFAVSGVGLLVSIIPLLLIDERPSKDEGRRTNDQLLSTNYHLPSTDDQLPTTDYRLLTTDDQLPATAPRDRWKRLLGRVPEPYRGMLRRPLPLLALLASPFVISCGAALLIPYLNLFFKQRFGLSDGALGLIFALLNVTTGLAALAGPALSTRIGKIQTVALTQALSIPFLLLLGFVPALGIAVGAALLRNALFNMGTPLYDAFAMERTEEKARPIVIGLVNGAYTAGYIVAPEISVAVQARYGFGPLFWATTACYALAMLLNVVLFVLPGVKRARTPGNLADSP